MALYNDVRPHDFSSIIGQKKVVDVLSNDILKGNVKGAYLFSGVRGTGKTTLARIFAEALNCDHLQPDGSPCGKCDSCTEIREKTSVDVIELDAASNNSVENIRDILDKIQYQPLHKYKVVILDEAHMLSTSASNALLKTLEEPPHNVVFILCTTEKHKILPTIISRCSCHDFERISRQELTTLIMNVCSGKCVSIEPDAATIIAKAANGSARDALSILDKFIVLGTIIAEDVEKTLGVTNQNIIFSVLNAIAAKDAGKAINAIKTSIEHGVSLPWLIEEMYDILLEMIEFQSTGDSSIIVGTGDYKDALIDLSYNLSSEKAFQILNDFRPVYQCKNDNMEFSLISAVIGVIHENTLIAELQEEITNIKMQLANLSQIDTTQVSIAGIQSDPICISTSSPTESYDRNCSSTEVVADHIEDLDEVSITDDSFYDEELPTFFAENDTMSVECAGNTVCPSTHEQSNISANFTDSSDSINEPDIADQMESELSSDDFTIPDNISFDELASLASSSETTRLHQNDTVAPNELSHEKNTDDFFSESNFFDCDCARR